MQLLSRVGESRRNSVGVLAIDVCNVCCRGWCIQCRQDSVKAYALQIKFTGREARVLDTWRHMRYRYAEHCKMQSVHNWSWIHNSAQIVIDAHVLPCCWSDKHDELYASCICVRMQFKWSGLLLLLTCNMICIILCNNSLSHEIEPFFTLLEHAVLSSLVLVFAMSCWCCTGERMKYMALSQCVFDVARAKSNTCEIHCFLAALCTHAC